MKRYIMECEVLSAVHIGSGEEINAYEYVITNKLYKLDLGNLLSSLSSAEQDNVLNMMEKNIVSYKDFLLDKLTKKQPELLPKVSSFSIPVSRSVLDFYQQKSNDPRNLLPVVLFQRSLDKPYFPGSSLKGAIRTAILFNRYSPVINNLLKQRNNWKFLRSNKWEEMVLGIKSAQEDPFKLIKISDSITPLETVVLDATVHTLRNNKWEKDKYRMLFEGAYKAKFKTELRIDDETESYLKKMKGSYKPISVEEIVKSCRDFYYANFENEVKRLKDHSAIKFYSALKPEMEKLVNDSRNLVFPLRVGWGSGFEAVTLGLESSFKDIIKIADKRLARPIKSVKLVQDILPLGWLKVTLSETNDN